MGNTITNPKTLRGKLRRLRADADAEMHKRTNHKSNSCLTIAEGKLAGANHKKLTMVRPQERFKLYSKY